VKKGKVSMWIGATALIVSGLACIDPIDTGDDIGLHVTEIQAPSSVPASGPITVTLVVALGGCQRFDHIAASRTEGSLLLAARGIEEGTTCPDILKHESHSYTAQGPFTNPLTIIVYRPTVDPLSKTVTVE
jgi:hypothetical protein